MLRTTPAMKQAINTRTQEEYDALMRYLDSNKYKWDSGHAPLEKNYWGKMGTDCCISIDQENELLRYGPVDWYKGINFQIIPYTEFAKANITESPNYEERYKEAVKLLEWTKQICSNIQRTKTYGTKFPETATLGVAIDDLFREHGHYEK